MPAAPNLRTSAVVLAALVAGYSARAFLQPRLPVVEAQSHSAPSASNESLAFELSGIGPNSALTVYNPADHTLYVYPEATQGNTHLTCSFMLHIGRPGAAIDRQNCAPGTAY